MAMTIARGLLAGAAGTAAMTASSALEQKLRGREPSTAPAYAAARVLGIEDFRSEQARNEFSNAVHWSYGTGWGVARALLGGFLPAPAATGAHFAVVWGSEQLMLPPLHVAPPLTEWEKEEIAVDALHHVVYAGATGIAYELLARLA